MTRSSPTVIEQPGASPAGCGFSDPRVGEHLQVDLHERHEAWLREQYQRDHHALERWERLIEDEAGRCDG